MGKALDRDTGIVVRSASAETGSRSGSEEFRAWLTARIEQIDVRVSRTSLEALPGWLGDPASGDLRHHSGGFFSVRGLQVQDRGAEDEQGWSQPIIDQPEIGILGILVKEFDGVPHLLMQAKMEPGNVNLVQLSPTVQATRSNFTGVHRGRSVPYVEYFLDPPSERVVVDSLQSEQGTWFLHKHNRNMVVLAPEEDVPVLDGFCWLTLARLHELLAEDDMVNMDTRTVLSCLPFYADDPDLGALHPLSEVLNVLVSARFRTGMRASPVPLRTIKGWDRTADGEIRHEQDRFFRVIGVDVAARGREVKQWSQPMIEPRGLGLTAMALRTVNGVPHMLLRTGAEPGLRETVEFGPTVQCTPQDLTETDPRPSFLDEVLRTPSDRILFDTVQSEEGGRFFAARTRNLVVDWGEGAPVEDGPDHLWVSLPQVDTLLRHSHYLNIQARSLVACVQSLRARLGRTWGRSLLGE